MIKVTLPNVLEGNVDLTDETLTIKSHAGNASISRLSINDWFGF